MTSSQLGKNEEEVTEINYILQFFLVINCINFGQNLKNQNLFPNLTHPKLRFEKSSFFAKKILHPS